MIGLTHTTQKRMTGKMSKILRNAARCKKCGDIIVSTYRHDFCECSCGAIFVDGGVDYCRRGGNPEDFEEWIVVERGMLDENVDG